MEIKIIKIFSYKNGWGSFLVQKEDGKKIVASGKIEFCPKRNEKISIEGQEYTHPTYGKQLKITSVESNNDLNEGVFNFLKSGKIKGIGEAKAKAIIEKYGKDTVEIIKNSPEKLLEINGVNEKIISELKTLCNSDDVMLYVKLYTFFKGDVSKNTVEKIIEQYGKNTLKVLKENPYKIIQDINGYAFLKVDKLALSSGIEKTSNKRVKAAITYTLEKAANNAGHCYLYIEELEKELLEILLPIPTLKENHSKALKNALADWENKKDKFIKAYKPSTEEIVLCDEWNNDKEDILNSVAEFLYQEKNGRYIVVENNKVYTRKYYDAECLSAKYINNMLKKEPVKAIKQEEIKKAVSKVEQDKGYNFDEIQKEAVIQAIQHRVYIIYGGPGCGKTSIIQAIATAWGNTKKAVLLSHTGKAAKRMKEATGFDSATISRVIYTGKADDKTLVIVDEASMIDIEMLCKLLIYAENANLILVGDTMQLASIGPGNVLKDLIESEKIPSIELKSAYRNTGSIFTNGQLLRKKEVKNFKNLMLDENFQFFEQDRNQIMELIWKRYKEALKRYDTKDVIVIVPNKKKSNSGEELVNKMIQEKLNQNENGKFRTNDRVMYLKNNYQKELQDKNGEVSVGLFNGETGTVIKVDNGEITVLFDDERIAGFSIEEQQNDIQLAYCITVFKSQGSEYMSEICVFNNEHCFLLNRNLFLTAITRGKKHVEILGDLKACNYAIYNTNSTKRNTYLSERIKSSQ